ncbi:3-oxoadipate enol-lactonase [Acinetobacter rudis]|uniref:3-oxoadipate enol-lactonase n=1 Tax=Acinetobacter rudis CIP 110305 TaxID=421052 RepID=S3NHV0_9GAMM|nr:3-oxoadipate enol-lactonase [Acinetobacter rudis]EPF73929.1 3-oxoadipate enol-lactonase [Acinetobacter rudis CIP 110305]
MSFTVTNRQGRHLSVSKYGPEHAPVIVLSNSLGTDQQMWQAQVEVLAQNYQVITYDTRGHGQSEVIAASSLKNLAEDVIDILDQLQLKHVHFCGISMGGITALYLGIHHAERFLSITVANSGAKIWTTEGWNSRADDVSANGLTDIVASTHTRWFSDHFDYQNSAVAQRTIQSLATTSAAGYAESCRALAHADLREELQQISIPTLIIAGQNDPVTTIADAQLMQQKIPLSELVVLDASHLSNIEQADKFTQALSQFIASIQ